VATRIATGNSLAVDKVDRSRIDVREATATKSYKVKLVSLENVQKVLTVETSGASLIYSPTWRVCQ